MIIDEIQRDLYLKLFSDKLADNLELCRQAGSIKHSMVAGDLTYVKTLVKNYADYIRGSLPLDGVHEVSVYSTLKASDGVAGVDLLILTVKNKASSSVEFKFKSSFSTAHSGDLDKRVEDFLINAYKVLLIDTMARQNLEVLNTFLADICKRASLGYTVSLDTTLDSPSKKIKYISGSELVLVADTMKLFDLAKTKYFSDTVTDKLKDKAIQKEIDAFSLCQTPVQFLASKNKLVQYFCETGKTKVTTLLKKSFSKKYSDKLIDGSSIIAHKLDDNIFSLYLVGNGVNDLLISFNVDTLESVV